VRTRRFARRQRTWYRRFEEIRWLDAAAGPDALLAEALRALG
jgi:tRNA A37 N6-isopentenylltransferase MiaA